jgi:hypothetical protein
MPGGAANLLCQHGQILVDGGMGKWVKSRNPQVQSFSPTIRYRKEQHIQLWEMGMTTG